MTLWFPPDETGQRRIGITWSREWRRLHEPEITGRMIILWIGRAGFDREKWQVRTYWLEVDDV